MILSPGAYKDNFGPLYGHKCFIVECNKSSASVSSIYDDLSYDVYQIGILR